MSVRRLTYAQKSALLRIVKHGIVFTCDGGRWPMNWRHQAACRDHDPELWFSGKPYEQAAALAVCRSCPVIDECRAFADDNNRINGYPLQGIWGGKQYGRTNRPRKERE